MKQMEFKDFYNYFKEGINMVVESESIPIGNDGDFLLFERGNTTITFIDLGLELEFNRDNKLIRRQLIQIKE